MFVCCDPSLSADAQVALILKTLCGFGEREIAAAFLATEAAVIKRLVRARQSLREGKISLDLPDGETLSLRTESVLQALYLLFNEGYKASHRRRIAARRSMPERRFGLRSCWCRMRPVNTTQPTHCSR